MTAQLKMWSYYQGEGVSNFDEAVPRLDYLFRRAQQEQRKSEAGKLPRALNIGIGNGWLERRCIDEGWQTAAVDPDDTAVGRLREYGVDAQTGVIESLPFKTGAFDFVFCSEVLEHLEDRQLSAGLSEVNRTLRPGGHLIGTVPNAEDLAAGLVICPDCGKRFHRWGHHQSFDTARIATTLRRAGFVPKQAATYAFPVFTRPHTLNRLRQKLRWVLGRLGSTLIYTNVFFLAEKANG